LKRRGLAVRSEGQAGGRHRRDPIQTFGRNRRMEIVNLIRGDRRPLEYGKSGMREDALLRLARRPIFSCHVTVVGCGSAPREAVAFIVCPHAMEAIAPR
jgi:hypothetical protein